MDLSDTDREKATQAGRALEEGDERNAHTQPAYRDVDPADIPMCECLKDTVARTWPYFESEIMPQMQAGKRVLIAGHGNSLRALVMRFEGIAEEEIAELNLRLRTMGNRESVIVGELVGS